MRFKHPLRIAVTSIVMAGAAIVLYSEKSTATTVFLTQAEHQSHSIINANNRQFTQVKLIPLTLSRFVLANVEIGNKKLIACWIQQPSPLTNTV
ncbi:hypothetical protein LC593_31785 [Nostoc sp. CHAB 5844]|nr:hypothetical protein [Nostoc sp. CHAB 5844]